MKKKRLTVLTIALIALAGIGVAVALSVSAAPASGVTKSNVDRLQVGMTRAQVDSILGPSHQLGGAHLLTDPAKEISHGSAGSVILVFDDDDNLTQVSWSDRVETFGEKLRRWLPWLPF